MTRYAPAREDGLKPYAVTKQSWGKAYPRIEWATNLMDAKARYGWTREMNTIVTVRRATPDDMGGNQ